MVPKLFIGRIPDLFGTTVNRTIVISNRQNVRRVNLAIFRRAARIVIADLLNLQTFELGVSLVGSTEMATLNESFLHHKGSTDVITFDYAEPRPERISDKSGQWDIECPRRALHGEIFICINEAESQACRFRTTWQKEIARYLIHGVLHLCGYDDLQTSARRRMKRTEDRLLLKLGKEIQLRNLGLRRKRGG